MANTTLPSISVGTILAVLVLILAVVFAAIGKMDLTVAILFVMTALAILVP